ncbi:NAD(P)-dependent dehydrogenase (short-subunit alcohol dehydrogenase family) [Desmospora activa DSM 45169]|uniref:NAD(P)-dependent dehydrogenase (Short-subunit alcohol dehydrogenase family) n=1 Tax=Desmospora activa DSM 45169 TaxID=1121389 RepID=A0A2T4Z6Y2_9BACL|nr:glucose 1-dehydrogenase [Desmospora activa]PTM57649.1 NAD(P)-dependent dehydrogenase (short-subunit alcohol dehydrogenase family) [Desmospora activa DSM 45169]
MEAQPKRIAVTGGGQGIGRCLVESFAEQGDRVYFLEVDREAGEECVTELAERKTAFFTQGDISQPQDVKGWMATIGEKEGALDLLVNNVGIMVNRPLEELTWEEWNRVLQVNLGGAFLAAQAAAPLLRKGGGGCIIQIASTRALMSEPHTESYAASKGGILALTHALAVSLGPDIRVNAISPGWIDVTSWQKRSNRQLSKLSREDHRQHPAGRVGRPEDIMKAVRFLASAEADFITGTNLVVDGGMTVKMIYEE